MSNTNTCLNNYYQSYINGSLSLWDAVQIKSADTNLDGKISSREERLNHNVLEDTFCQSPSTSLETHKLSLYELQSLSYYQYGSFQLIRPTKIYGYLFMTGQDMQFHPNGMIQSATWAMDTTVMGITYKEGTRVTFDENGRIASGILARDTLINNTVMKSGSAVNF